MTLSCNYKQDSRKIELYDLSYRLKNLTDDEVEQLEAIGTTTLSAAQWAALAAAANAEYHYPNSNATDHGVTGDSDTIKYYVDYIGTSKKATLVLKHIGTGNTTIYTLTTSETIPDNITLEIENGAILDGAGTLTLYSPSHIIASPSQQIFSGAGTVSFTSSEGMNNLCWFGGLPDGATTDFVAAMKKAVAATATGGTLHIPSHLPTVYYKYDNAANGFTDATTIDRSMKIQIDGTIKQTGYAYQVDPSFIFYITGDNVTITGKGTLQGPGTHEDPAAPATRANEAGLIYVTGDNFSMSGITLKDQPTMAIRLLNSDFSKIFSCRFEGGPSIAGATGTEHFYILATSCDSLSIMNNYFRRVGTGAASQGIYMEVSCGFTKITGNTFISLHEHPVYVNTNSSVISNNTVYYSQAAVDQTGIAIKVLGKNNVIDSNSIYGAALGGIGVLSAQSCVISNNTIYGHGAHGIVIFDQYANADGLSFNVISGNTISARTDGATVNSGIAYTGMDGLTGSSTGSKIVNNIIYKSGTNPIVLRHIDATKQMTYFDVSGNQLISCDTIYGIYALRVHHSRFENNMIVNSTGANAVGFIFVDPCTFNRIINNNVIDNQGVPTLARGILYSGAGVTDNTANGNYIRNASLGNPWGFNTTTRNYVDNYQPTAIDKGDTAPTLTLADLMSKIIYGTPTAARDYTLPTGASIDAGGSFTIGDYFDWSLINRAAAYTITLLDAAGAQVLGSRVIGAATTARFRTMKNGTANFTVYRIS